MMTIEDFKKDINNSLKEIQEDTGKQTKALQEETHKWMLTVSYWMEYRSPMEELEKVPKELKGSATL